MPETTRPLSVTLIAWFFIIWSLFSILPKIYLLIDPETYRLARELEQSLASTGLLRVPLWFQLTHAFIGVPVIIVPEYSC